MVTGAMILAFFLFLTSINGGLTEDAVVPTGMLALVGTVVFVITSKRFDPESFVSSHPNEESS